MNKDIKKKRFKWYHWLLSIVVIILIACIAFLSYLSLTEYKPEAIEDSLRSTNDSSLILDKNKLSILSFNTGYASLGKDADFILDGGKGSGKADKDTILTNMEGIKNILETYKSDIYMIQEIDLASARTFDIDQLTSYNEVLDGYNWTYAPNFLCNFVPYPLSSPIGRIDSGIANYTQFKVNESKRIALPNPFTWPVSMANLKRSLLMDRLPIANSDKELVIINMHLEAYDDGEGKIAQTQLLLNLIKAEYEKGNYVIAGGDFNQIFPDVETYIKETSEWVPGKLDALPEDLVGYRYVYDDSLETCRLLNEAYNPSSDLTQLYVIDGFIISPNIEVDLIETIDANFEYSDHNPVHLEITLK